MKRTMTAAIAAALLVAAVAIPAAGASSGAPSATAAATKTVKLVDSRFSPSSATVSRGTKVRFVWAGNLAHNLKGPGVPSTYTRSARRRGSVTVRLARKGSFLYQCTLHPGMNARIRVR